MRKTTFITGIAILLFAIIPNFVSAQAMVLEYNTNLGDAQSTIVLPLEGTVNVTVDWGDGGQEPFTIAGEKNHTYSTAGIYYVSISGSLTAYGKNTNRRSLLANSNKKLINVSSFGDLGLTSLSYSFLHAENLIEVPELLPPTVNNMSFMFSLANSFNGNVGVWDVSNVTNMSSMFGSATSFNQDLESWDVSNVTNMGNMFGSATSFNQDLESWDVSNVITMYGMFNQASSFNGNIGNWNVSNVVAMDRMFRYATSFNRNIGNWDVSSVASMSSMFENAQSFNQDIDNWTVSNVISMSNMFKYATSFNGNIGNWDVLNVSTMEYMFDNATSFNQDIGAWVITNVENVKFMFQNATLFNQNIGNWDITGVRYIDFMFYNATSFNWDIGNWDVSNLTSLRGMFAYATSFNKSLSSWDLSNVRNLGGMFVHASSFNQDVGNWDVSMATDMWSMFEGASAFNQDISNWDVSNVTNMNQMFYGANIFNQSIGSWDVSQVTDMSGMFRLTPLFNQDISSWDVSSVTNMYQMFANSSAFNQNIGNWDVSNVTNMGYMFFISYFNQDIGSWNVSNVTNMEYLFYNNSLFNQNLSNWIISNVINMNNIFNYSRGLSTTNYDAILIGWASQDVNPNLNFNANVTQYSCNAVDARAILTGVDNNWTITDAGLENLPEISVIENSILVSNNGAKDFGTVGVGSSIDLIFTIENSGCTDLLLNGNPKIAISGLNAGDFSINELATSSIVTVDDFTTFTITFQPTDAGIRTAEISIANNDADENPFVFTIQGEGELSCFQLPTITAQDATPPLNTAFTTSISTTDLPVDCNVISYEFDVTYDASKVEYTGANVVGTIASAGMLVVNDATPGLLKIVCIAAGVPFVGEGDIVNLEFNSISCESSTLDLSNFKYNGEENTNLVNGTFNVEYDNEVTVEDAGGAVGVPLYVDITTQEILSNCAVSTYSFTLNFDETHIEYDGFDVLNSIDPGSSVIIDNSTAGVLSVTATSSGVFTGVGNLLSIKFNALTVGISDTELSNFQFDGNLITVMNNGVVVTELLGDVSGDGVVNGYDAALVLFYSLGLDTSIFGVNTPWEEWRIIAGDVDGDGSLTALDAALLMRYAADIINTFPAEDPGRSNFVVDTDINIELEGDYLVFYSRGQLLSVDILSATGNNELGEAEKLVDNVLTASNIVDGYKVGFASTYEIDNGTAFMRIPVSNFDGATTFTTKINGFEHTYTVAVTSTTDLNANTLAVYPNPTSGMIHISGIDSYENIQVVDITGSMIFNSSDVVNKIDLSNKAKGVYFIKIRTADKVYTQQVVIK